MKLWNYRGEQKSITEALQIKLPEHAVISVTGAGGKTSLIFAWARELAADGKNVVITTTTHDESSGDMIFLQYLARRPRQPSKIPPTMMAPTITP